MAATAATAAAAVHLLLHQTAALPSSATAHTLSIPRSQLHLPRPRPLHVKPSLPSLLSASHHHHHHLCPRATAAYFSDDDRDEEEKDGQQKLSPSSRSPAAAGDERRLYVGNLPYSMSTAQLRDIFSQAGTVTSVEIVTDRVTDRSRGFGFVTMGSGDEASEAIRMYDGAQIGGRTAKVNFPEVPRGGEREMLGPRMRRGSGSFAESPYKVYAGNLGWTVTSQLLRETFAAQPGLLGAKVVYDRDSGLSRGFGFLSFTSPEEAQAAIDAMNGKEVEGRPLRLSLAAGTARPSVATEQLSSIES